MEPKTTRIESALVEALGLDPGRPTAIIGSGGKTTLLFKLAEYWIDQGLSPLVSTTTHMFLPQETPWLSVSRYQACQALEPKACFLYGEVLAPSGSDPAKVRGLPPDQLLVLQQTAPSRPLLYEADGSRHMPLKFHGEHEPVVATPSHYVILVAGLSPWGQPITAQNCHRLELQAQFQGLWLDQDSLGRILELAISHCHPNVVVLNQADRLPNWVDAAHLSQELSERLSLKVVTTQLEQMG